MSKTGGARQRMRRTALSVMLAAGAAAGMGSSAWAADEIVIGTSLPMAGPMAENGAALRDAYQLAVDQVNAQGGIKIGAEAHLIKLIVLDNQGDANQVSGQVRKLVQQEGAVALLGAVTPPYSVPAFIVADQLKTPIVGTACPVLACIGSRKGGYMFAWDVYAYEPTATLISWAAADLVESNKKVAIFSNTDDDGETWGKLWSDQAAAHGYEIVYWGKIPVGTTNFAAQIDEAKQSGAEIMLGQLIPPDAIALWKQMKALEFAPKMVTCEKCASGAWWPDTLGAVADGTMTSDIWSPETGGPGTDVAMKGLSDKYKGKTLSIAVAGFSSANVVLDAIAAAQSLDGAAINAEIARTDKDYAVGNIKFGEEHGARLEPNMLQWQGGTLVRIVPTDNGGAPVQSPAMGLQ